MTESYTFTSDQLSDILSTLAIYWYARERDLDYLTESTLDHMKKIFPDGIKMGIEIKPEELILKNSKLFNSKLVKKLTGRELRAALIVHNALKGNQ